MGCARCHSHKYDPISQKEFYQFYAFFNNVPERGLDGQTGNAAPVLPLPSPAQQKTARRAGCGDRRRDGWRCPTPSSRRCRANGRRPFAQKIAPGETDGLTAHYELDGSFSDISGRYQHGRTIVGDPTFGAGKIGRAVSFDGDTEVSFGNVGAFDRSDPFSLAVWLRGTRQPADGRVPETGRTQSARGYEWVLDDIVLAGIQRWAARLTITLASDGPGGAIQIRTRERIRLGDWYHVALTYDGSGKAAGLVLYVDGKAFATDVVRDALAGSIATDAPLRIGSKTLGKPFVGQIDDLRLYSRALTAEQVEQLAIHYAPRVNRLRRAGKAVGRRRRERARILPHVRRARRAARRSHDELKALQTQKQDLEESDSRRRW